MIPRGEVGLIFADHRAQRGHPRRQPLRRAAARRARHHADDAAASCAGASTRSAAGPRRGPTAPRRCPEGGWLQVDDGVVDLVERSTVAPVARRRRSKPRAWSRTARARDRGCSTGSASGATRRCAGTTTPTKQLFDVLTEGDARSWRFLETTGVLERTLPELAEAVDRRRSDPFLHRSRADPALLAGRPDQGARATDDRAAAASTRALEHPEWLLLAALILDTAGDDSSPVELARRIVHRLDLGAAGRAGDRAARRRLRPPARRGAARSTGSTSSGSYPIAIHLDTPRTGPRSTCSRSRSATSTPWDRGGSTSCSRWCSSCIEQPDVTGLDARNLVERRRAEALRLAGDNPRVVDRIEHAPRALPAQPGSARHRAPGRVRRTGARHAARRAWRCSASPGRSATTGARPHVAHRDRGARPSRPARHRGRRRSPTPGSTSSTPPSRRGATAPRSTRCWCSGPVCTRPGSRRPSSPSCRRPIR